MCSPQVSVSWGFGVTYEGLKHSPQYGHCQVTNGFGVTYEGLKLDCEIEYVEWADMFWSYL